VQPGIGVGAGALSFGLNQPFPELIGFPAKLVNVGSGRVLIGPAAVYENDPAALAGGHAFCV
jgi:hypothetical protein